MLNAYRDAIRDGVIPSTQPYAGSNIHFVKQEAYANQIAKNIADAIGISITPPNTSPASWPPNGYEPL